MKTVLSMLLILSLGACMTLPAGWNNSVAADVTAVADAAASLWTVAAPTDAQKCLLWAAEAGATSYQTARKVDSKGKVLDRNAALKLACKAMQEYVEFVFPAVMVTASGKLENLVRLELKVDALDCDQVLGLCLAGINAKKGGA
jgi:hypothetical protein